jgi:hypothetical protein
MRENKGQEHSQEKGSRGSRCESNHLFGGAPCPKAAEDKVDSLLLCEKHALEVKLEGQIACWGGMLFHIDLWSREAARRGREDVVGLLEVQRAEAMSARQLARTDLDRFRSRDTSLGALGSAEVVLPRDSLKRGSLPLPPRGAPPLAQGLRRLRRR